MPSIGVANSGADETFSNYHQKRKSPGYPGLFEVTTSRREERTGVVLFSGLRHNMTIVYQLY